MDINLFRVAKGGNPELVRESQRRRFKPVEIVDQIIEADEKWNKAYFEGMESRKKLNALSKQIGALKKKKEDASELMEQVRALKISSANLAKEEKEALENRDALLNQIGNLVAEDVPVSQDEDNNKVVKTSGDCTSNPEKHIYHHHELLWMIGGYDPKAGSNVAGHRGYFLTGPGVQLSRALVNYGLDFLHERGFTEIQTPQFMSANVMQKVAQLGDFHEQLYSVSTASSADNKDAELKYLIATSEQPLCAMHMSERFSASQLPIRYAGVSTCFRKESGRFGQDTWGIFRVHQFDKLEQFAVCDPSSSWEEHEKLRTYAEDYHASLGIPYRTVVIVSGELNDAAAKKYDVEGWFPAFHNKDGTHGGFRELVSCSNCTDYQSRKLGIRFDGPTTEVEASKPFCHLLNSTLCATTRVISALLENHQEENGIRIPPVLVPYMRGIDFLPFVKKPPKAGAVIAKERGKKK